MAAFLLWKRSIRQTTVLFIFLLIVIGVFKYELKPNLEYARSIPANLVSYVPQWNIHYNINNDSLYLDYLSLPELEHLVKFCPPAIDKTSHVPIGKCKFMNGANRLPIALSSQPGSGNTWLRGLLEQATGVCTGSVYCDYGLKKTGFNGEGLWTGSVLVVKTHNSIPMLTKSLDSTMKFWYTDTKQSVRQKEITMKQILYHGMKPKYVEVLPKPKFGSVITLVRNPFDICISEWNRKNSKSHTNIVGEEMFGKNKLWNNFVHSAVKHWEFVFSSPHLLLIRYEDLQRDAVSEIKRILDFIHFPYTEEQLQKNLQHDFEAQHRNHSTDSFEHFTSEQKVFINSVINQLKQKLKLEHAGQTFGVEEYLKT